MDLGIRKPYHDNNLNYSSRVYINELTRLWHFTDWAKHLFRNLPWYPDLPVTGHSAGPGCLTAPLWPLMCFSWVRDSMWRAIGGAEIVVAFGFWGRTGPQVKYL